MSECSVSNKTANKKQKVPLKSLYSSAICEDIFFSKNLFFDNLIAKQLLTPSVPNHFHCDYDYDFIAITDFYMTNCTIITEEHFTVSLFVCCALYESVHFMNVSLS